MRLGQLARQLEIKTNKIVSFLEEKKNITIKSHPNSKIEDDLIEVVTNHFKPITKEESKEEVMATVPMEGKEPEIEKVIKEDIY